MAETIARETQTQPPLPTTADELLALFTDLDIAVALHEHEPVFTVAESDHLKKSIPGQHCRNLFLRDQKKAMFLVVAANETQIDLKKLQSLLGSDRLSFGSAERLWQHLGVRPGSVCPFAIINDTDQAVKIVLDQHMMSAETVCYHPMENHLTVGLTPACLLKFIDHSGHTPHILDLSAAAPDAETA